MKILISNDDGFDAPGIKALNAVLSEHHDTVIVAPDRNRSGASSSLTLDNPIRLNEVEKNVYAISGTPADCIHIARSQIFHSELPDLVVCGINMGANLGDDVIYSGTVAGAIEGAFLGVPAIATSQIKANKDYLNDSAKTILKLIESGVHEGLARHQILNINFPDLPAQNIQGFRVTRQGHRHRDNVIITSDDPRGEEIYWLGPQLEGKSAIKGTDFEAIEAGYVSITPLTVDLTADEAFDRLRKKLQELN